MPAQQHHVGPRALPVAARGQLAHDLAHLRAQRARREARRLVAPVRKRGRNLACRLARRCVAQRHVHGVGGVLRVEATGLAVVMHGDRGDPLAPVRGLQVGVRALAPRVAPRLLAPLQHERRERRAPQWSVQRGAALDLDHYAIGRRGVGGVHASDHGVRRQHRAHDVGRPDRRRLSRCAVAAP